MTSKQSSIRNWQQASYFEGELFTEFRKRITAPSLKCHFLAPICSIAAWNWLRRRIVETVNLKVCAGPEDAPHRTDHDNLI